MTNKLIKLVLCNIIFMLAFNVLSFAYAIEVNQGIESKEAIKTNNGNNPASNQANKNVVKSKNDQTSNESNDNSLTTANSLTNSTSSTNSTASTTSNEVKVEEKSIWVKIVEPIGSNEQPIAWYMGFGGGRQAHTLNNATEYSFNNAKDLKDAYYGYVKLGYEWKYMGLEGEIQSANTLDQTIYFDKIDTKATISYDAWDFSLSAYWDLVKSSKYTFAPVFGIGLSKLKTQALDGFSPLKKENSVAIRYGLIYRQQIYDNFTFELGAISKLLKGQVALNYVQDKITIHNFNFNAGFIYNLHK